MDEIIKWVFSQNWVIAGLFVFSFVAMVWKGIPYLLEKYDKTTETFISTLEKMQNAHNENIKTMNESFLLHIEKNDNGHQVIHWRLDEMILLLKSKKK